jgi:lantibiotic biosynthesis protein
MNRHIQSSTVSSKDDSYLADSPYLSAAIEIARQLVRNALPVGPGVTWEGDEFVGDENNHTIVRMLVGSDLYSGSAGIAWFLGNIAPFDPSGEFAYTAAKAMSTAVAGAANSLKSGLFSLLSGSTGTALAAIDVADRLKLVRLRRLALSLVTKTCELIAREPMHEFDLIGGAAGIIIGLLAIHRRCGDPVLLDTCRIISEGLLKRRRHEWWGSSWSENDSIPSLCGLGHGMSGVGWALAEMFWATGEQNYLDTAQEAFRYERSWFSPEQCAWPDLREPKSQSITDRTWPGWMTAWCHGALGIGAVRLRLYEASGDMSALGEASAAIQAARNMVIHAGIGLQASQVSDVTLCHGLGGAAELFLLAYEIFSLDDHLRAARQVGRLCVRIYGRNDNKWTYGLRGAEYVPGLFLGLAGIGTTMLRLHDPSAIGSPLLPGRLPAGTPAAASGQAKT